MQLKKSLKSKQAILIFFYISLTIPLSFDESNAVKPQIATADLCFESNAQY